MSTVGRLGATSTNEQMRRDLRTTQTSTAYPNGGGPSETERPKVKRAARLPPSRRSVRPCSTGGCTLGASTPSSALSSSSPPPWERGGVLQMQAGLVHLGWIEPSNLFIILVVGIRR